MSRFFRHFEPPAWYLWTFAIVYLLFFGFSVFMWFVLQLDIDHVRGLTTYRSFVEEFVSKRFLNAQILPALFLSLVLGLVRAWVSSPWERPGYRRWFRTMPWEPGKDLPMGSIEWTLSDAVCIAPLLLAAYWSELIRPSHIYALCGAAYLFALAKQLGDTRARPYAWFTVYVLVGAIWLVRYPIPLTLCITATYLIARVGLRSALEHFHTDELLASEKKNRAQVPSVELVWPYTALRHDPIGLPILRSNAVTLCILIGWLLWTVLSFPFEARDLEAFDRAAMGWIALCAFILALARVGVYLSRGVPPISIAGRVKLGRWIIPGYDVIIIAPMLIALTGWGLPRIMIAAGFHFRSFSPLTITALGLLFFLSVPSVTKWSLTGDYRSFPTRPPQPNLRKPAVQR